MMMFFQAEDVIRYFCLSRGLGDVYKRQEILHEELGPQLLLLGFVTIKTRPGCWFYYGPVSPEVSPPRSLGLGVRLISIRLRARRGGGYVCQLFHNNRDLATPREVIEWVTRVLTNLEVKGTVSIGTRPT